jgi:hypothetical protein
MQSARVALQMLGGKEVKNSTITRPNS